MAAASEYGAGHPGSGQLLMSPHASPSMTNSFGLEGEPVDGSIGVASAAENSEAIHNLTNGNHRDPMFWNSSSQADHYTSFLANALPYPHPAFHQHHYDRLQDHRNHFTAIPSSLLKGGEDDGSYILYDCADDKKVEEPTPENPESQRDERSKSLDVADLKFESSQKDQSYERGRKRRAAVSVDAEDSGRERDGDKIEGSTGGTSEGPGSNAGDGEDEDSAKTDPNILRRLTTIYCPHGKIMQKCDVCRNKDLDNISSVKLPGICHHNKRRCQCIQCFDEGTGGSILCEHRRQRYACFKCFDEGKPVSSICEHRCIRLKCAKCTPDPRQPKPYRTRQKANPTDVKKEKDGSGRGRGSRKESSSRAKRMDSPDDVDDVTRYPADAFATPSHHQSSGKAKSGSAPVSESRAETASSIAPSIAPSESSGPGSVPRTSDIDAGGHVKGKADGKGGAMVGPLGIVTPLQSAPASPSNVSEGNRKGRVPASEERSLGDHRANSAGMKEAEAEYALSLSRAQGKTSRRGSTTKSDKKEKGEKKEKKEKKDKRGQVVTKANGVTFWRCYKCGLKKVGDPFINSLGESVCKLCSTEQVGHQIKKARLISDTSRGKSLEGNDILNYVPMPFPYPSHFQHAALGGYIPGMQPNPMGVFPFGDQDPRTGAMPVPVPMAMAMRGVPFHPLFVPPPHHHAGRPFMFPQEFVNSHGVRQPSLFDAEQQYLQQQQLQQQQQQQRQPRPSSTSGSQDPQQQHFFEREAKPDEGYLQRGYTYPGGFAVPGMESGGEGGDAGGVFAVTMASEVMPTADPVWAAQTSSLPAFNPFGFPGIPSTPPVIVSSIHDQESDAPRF
ncbi:hypothetical protein HDU76_003811 [Blyttiomyces sp. JEL0837]|nr:hypothetical protein HDU76_003811 [Blyttiomyces sp. JEL0837]